MFKQAEAGYVELVSSEQTSLERFFPAVFVLVSTVVITSAVLQDLPALVFLPPLIWFIGVPVWDRLFRNSLRRNVREETDLSASSLQAELSATTAGLAALAVLLLANNSMFQSTAMLVALSVTGGVFLSLAAVPAMQRRDGKYFARRGYSGLRSNLFQAMLLIPVLGNSARSRHYNAMSSQADEGSARMGETFFAFARRFIVFGFTRSLGSSANKTPGELVVNGADSAELIKLSGFGLLFVLLAYVAGGSQLIFLVVAQAMVALWQILAIEYAEHYGILKKQASTNSADAHHEHLTWKGKGQLNNALLSGRTEHSSKRRYIDENTELADRELPCGYNAVSMLVLWPSKWFSLMDKKLAESVEFDLHEVNLAGNAYVGLMEKYHHQGRKPGVQS